MFGSTLVVSLCVDRIFTDCKLRAFLGARMIKLPELLIQVNNDLNFTRYFLPPFEKDKAEEKDICAIFYHQEKRYWNRPKLCSTNYAPA